MAQINSHFAQVAGPPGPIFDASLWKKAATAQVYQTAIGGVNWTIACNEFGVLVLAQLTALNTDQIIINAAIVYVNGLGGGSLYVEGAIYTTAATITMLASVYLYGTGENTLITGAGNFHLITINAVDDCTVEMLQLSHTLVAGNFECISIDNSDRFYIRRVRIIDSPRFGIGGTALTAMTDGWVVDCHISGTQWEGIIFYMAVANLITNLFIMVNYIANTTDGAPIGISRAERPMIANNITEASGGFSGIYVNFSTSTIVADNIVDDPTGAGIFIDSGDNASVTGNIVYSSTSQGIRADNLGNSVFDGNAIYESVANGIVLNGCVNNSVTDNVVQGSGDDGLELDADCDYNQIHGNNFISNTGFGVNITAGATENHVQDNYYSGNTAGAINDLGTDTATHEVEILAPNQDSYVGAAPSNHRGQQCLDNVPTQVPFEIPIPNAFQELVTAHVIYVTGADGIINRSVATNFGKVCAGEQIDAHTDAIAAADIAGNTTDEFECDDVSAALDGLALGDWIGLTWTNFGAAAGTIDATVWVIGIRIRYV